MSPGPGSIAGRTGRIPHLVRLVALAFLVHAGEMPANAVEAAPAGQIVIDPEHPQSLMRQGSGHVFICGPGDPEDFLYAGRRNPDGTRDGDQVARIRKLIEHGGNCIYVQVVRTHGGDAKRDRTQNPFVDSDPARGLDEDILDQWEEWFTLMDRNGILIYLLFYDDGSRIWDTGDRVGPEERAFVEAIVARFKHHENLIWVVGEESEERYRTGRVQAIAEVIRRADDRGHLIGDHHLSGTTFKAWQPGGAINHFSMQLSKTGDEAHAGAVEALQKAAGRYQVIFSESTAMRTDPDGMRHHAWAVAMGGVMPMLLGMDIAGTPVEILHQCRFLQEFFEASDFYTMSPHDELKHDGTRYVLADPGRSYIAYADDLSGKMGIKDLPAGEFAVTWMDCRTGRTVASDSEVSSRDGDRSFDTPAEIGRECVAWIRRTDAGRDGFGAVAATRREYGRGTGVRASSPNEHRARRGDRWDYAALIFGRGDRQERGERLASTVRFKARAQVVQHVAPLLPAGRHHRQHPLHEPAPVARCRSRR